MNVYPLSTARPSLADDSEPDTLVERFTDSQRVYGELNRPLSFKVGIEAERSVYDPIVNKKFKVLFCWPLLFSANILTLLKCFDTALKISNLFTSPSIRDMSRASIIQGLTLDGQIDKAIKTVESIASPDSRDEILSSISLQLMERGDFEKALEIVERVVNPLYKDEALENIAEQAIAVGKIDQGIEITNKISNDTNKNHTLEILAKNLIKDGYLEKAHHMAELATQTTSKDRILGQIAEFEIHRHALEKATEIAMKMKFKDSILKTIVRQLTDLDQTDKAIDITASVKEAQLKDSLFCCISESLAVNKKFKEAITIGELIVEYRPTAAAASAIAKELMAWEGQVDFIQAIEDFNEASEERDQKLLFETKSLVLAEQFQQAAIKANSISSQFVTEIAILVAVYTLTENLRFGESLDVARQIDCVLTRDSVIRAIGKTFIESSELNRLETIGEHIQDPTIYNHFLQDIARDLASNNKFDEAREITRSMTDMSIKETTRNLIECYAAINKIDSRIEYMNYTGRI